MSAVGEDRVCFTAVMNVDSRAESVRASAEALAHIFVVFARKNASALLQLRLLDMEGGGLEFVCFGEVLEGSLVSEEFSFASLDLNLSCVISGGGLLVVGFKLSE